MPIDFRVDPVTRCVFARGVLPVTDQDLTRYQMALASHPDHGAGFDQLVDLTEVDGSLAVSSTGIQVASRVAGEYAPFLEGTKLAIVAPEPTAFGMARMFSAYAGHLLTIRAFHDMEAARAWLGLGAEGVKAG